MTYDDTIAAIATAPGEGGVGIIRLSGPEAPEILAKLWQGRHPVEGFESHKLYHGPITDPQNGHVLDRVLAVWMKAPRSYTGEEVVEIHAHGGPILLEGILQALLQNGARLARPGEFTERAFMNERIDLAQAEGVADLISSRSELARELASDQVKGRLSEEVGRIRNDLVVMRAQCEAMIDFPEDEDVNVLGYDEVIERLDRLSEEIHKWLSRYEEGRIRREGFRVVLAGRPNVGKSSLLNALLSEDRAIVHEEAGTTRDTIEAAIHLNGLLVRLFDTAGLREGKRTVETEGVRRSWKHIEQADLILFVIDRSEPINDADHQHYNAIREHAHMVVLNKIDLLGPVERDGWREASFWRTEPLGRAPDLPCRQAGKGMPRRQDPSPSNVLSVSAKTGEGLEALKAAIFEKGLPHGRASDQWFLANQRHKACLEKTLEALAAVRESAEKEMGLEFLAADLLVAANHLGEITGEITHEEILGEIFSRFCLGK